MKAAPKTPASTCTRSSAHGLTLAQLSAVDLLAAGKNDTDTAAALGVNRVTVTRWRLYSPDFRAALAAQRAAVRGAAADRLRALLPKALDALADALERAEGDERTDVALAVRKLAGPLPVVPSEPTDPEDIVRGAAVERERAQKRTRHNDLLDQMSGLPGFDDHVNAVRTRFDQMAASEGDEPPFRPAGGPG